jgi:F0F1-type ATP synthase membrane subunit b/b'
MQKEEKQEIVLWHSEAKLEQQIQDHVKHLSFQWPTKIISRKLDSINKNLIKDPHAKWCLLGSKMKAISFKRNTTDF